MTLGLFLGPVGTAGPARSPCLDIAMRAIQTGAHSILDPPFFEQADER
jgi:hypothetical protein